MNKKRFFIIIYSLLIPIMFNNMINLSERSYWYQWQADLVDLLVIIGLIGIITVQTYGTYKLLEKL